MMSGVWCGGFGVTRPHTVDANSAALPSRKLTSLQRLQSFKRGAIWVFMLAGGSVPYVLCAVPRNLWYYRRLNSCRIFASTVRAPTNPLKSQFSCHSAISLSFSIIWAMSSRNPKPCMVASIFLFTVPFFRRLKRAIAVLFA